MVSSILFDLSYRSSHQPKRYGDFYDTPGRFFFYQQLSLLVISRLDVPRIILVGIPVQCDGLFSRIR